MTTALGSIDVQILYYGTSLQYLATFIRTFISNESLLFASIHVSVGLYLPFSKFKILLTTPKIITQ